MDRETQDTDAQVQQAVAGDEKALAELFSQFRARLRRMVSLRLDRRLKRRVDPSDVLQEAYLDMARRIGEYVRTPTLSLFLWMRLLTGQRLIDVHRQHLGAQMRDAGREISLYQGALPGASSVSLAEHLLGQITSASRVAQRAEMQVLLQEGLNRMDPTDREVLTLRHFEMLSNTECAQELGISQKAASNRYIRAVIRLKEILDGVPGFKDYTSER